MQIDHLKERCSNPNCECDVEAGHPYCSEHCRTAAEYSDSADEEDEVAGGASCNCGHDGCGNPK